MLKVTVDRKWLDEQLDANRNEALVRAKKHNVPESGSVVTLQKYFNTTKNEFRPGSAEHDFLKTYEPRILDEDVVMLG